MNALPTSRLLLGPMFIAIGSVVLYAVAFVLAQLGPGSDAFGSALVGVVVAAVLAGLLLAWRAGQPWARWVAWGVAILVIALCLLLVFVGVWAAGYYDVPTADVPMLVGLPVVGAIGSGLVIWTVVRGGDRVAR